MLLVIVEPVELQEELSPSDAVLLLSSAPEPYGVMNAKIDSPQQFEFDYRSKTDCKDITFFYKFYDQNGKLVDQRQDEKHNPVLKDKTYHIDVANFGAGIAATAVRFDAIPTCRA